MTKRLLFIIWALLFVSAGACAQGGCTGQKPLNGMTTGGYLKGVANASVRVCSDTLNPCTTIPLYSDAALTQSISNPVTTDANGNYQYCAAPGSYNEQLTSTTSVFAAVNNTPVSVGDAPSFSCPAGDNTTAIQAAITALGSNAAMRVPPNCNSNHLTINSTLFTVRGYGRGKSGLTQSAGATGTGIDINPSGSASVFTEYLHFADLDLFGVTGSSHGMTSVWSTYLNLARIRLRNFGGDGLRTFQNTALHCYDSEFKFNTGNGASLGQQNDVGLWSGCGFVQNGGWGAIVNYTGLAADRSNSNTFTAATFAKNTSGGLWVRGQATNGVSVLGGYFENNNGPDMQVGETGVAPYGVAVKGVYFHGIGSVAHDGISVQGGTYLGVANSFFETYNTGNAGVNLVADVATDYYGNVFAGTGAFLKLSDGTTAASPGSGGWWRGIPAASTDITQALPGNSTTPLKRYVTKAGVTEFQVRTDASVQLGPSTVTPGAAAADLAVARNDTTGLMVRIEQQGAGASATPTAQVSCGTGASYVGDCIDVQNKGTGSTQSILRARTGSTTNFEVKIDGTHIGANGSALGTVLTAGSTLTFTAISAQTCQEQTLTVTNASTSNKGVTASPLTTLGNVNLAWQAWVSSSGTVSVRVCNVTTGSITPNAVVWGVTVIQ